MTNQPSPFSRSTTRAGLTAAARLTWKDANGAVRFTSVRARDITDAGAVVDCDQSVALPLYRLVHLQMEKSVRDNPALPAELRTGRVLAAVWQASACQPETGRPGSYALRFMTAGSTSRVETVRRAS